MQHDDLIRSAETIVIVRLKSQRSTSTDSVDKTGQPIGPKRYILDTTEVLKGKARSSYEYISRGEAPDSDYDFDGHTAKAFWKDNTGRSESPRPCTMYGPDHSFREGRTYLYFPDRLGAMKSAEIVRDSNDSWLGYVRAKLKKAANPTVERDVRKGGSRPSP